MHNFNAIFRRQVSGFRDVVSRVFIVYTNLLLILPSIIFYAVFATLDGSFAVGIRVAYSELRGCATGIIPPNPSTPP